MNKETLLTRRVEQYELHRPHIHDQESLIHLRNLVSKCHVWQSGSYSNTPSVRNIRDSKEMSCLIKLVMSNAHLKSIRKHLGMLLMKMSTLEAVCTKTVFRKLFSIFVLFSSFQALFKEWCPFCVTIISSLMIIYFAIISLWCSFNKFIFFHYIY